MDDGNFMNTFEPFYITDRSKNGVYDQSTIEKNYKEI